MRLFIVSLVLSFCAYSSLASAKSISLDATSPKQLRERVDGASGSDRVCERVKRLGSNMPTIVCMTRDQRDYEQALAREKMRASSGTRRSGD